MWHDMAGIDTWHDWKTVRSAFATEILNSFGHWITENQAHFREQLIFALGRFDEGVGLVRFFEKHYAPPLGAPGRKVRVLDIGAGNGGVTLAAANCRRYEAVALDIVPNRDLLRCRKTLGVPVGTVVGTGNRLPFDRDSFDIVLLLDMIEHVSDPHMLGSEVMRVLAPGGVCMLTTPPRLRYLLRADPHFGIRGLLLFPNSVQRFIVDNIFRRRVRGEDGMSRPAYDVEHIFWHVKEITKLFPEPKEVDVLYNKMLHPGSPRFSRWWLEYETRERFWDRILIRKPAG